MTRKQRRMMEEAMAESLNTILPEELMIEILYRVESSNPLQLRCVCKLWKSLILDPQFVAKHVQRWVTDMAVLCEHFNAFILEHITNNPVVHEDAEEEDDDDDNVHEDDEEASEGDDDDIVDEDGEEAAEEKEEDDDHNIDDDDDEAAEEDDVLKQVMMNTAALLDKLLVNIRSIKGNKENINIDMQMQLMKDGVKCLKGFIRIVLKSATSSSSS